MDERVFAEGPGRIALSGVGERAVLSITDGATVCFAVETAVLAGVLDGVPVQLSREGSHCRIEAFGASVRLSFTLLGAGRGSCVVAASSLAESVDWVYRRERG